MAALVTGPRAARVQVERGRTLEERMSDTDGARAAYEAALEAAPEHTPAFLAVERTARAAGDFARLAALYAAEAERTDGANAEYWRARSMRMARLATAGEPDKIAARFQDLMAAGGTITPELRREHQVFLSSTECWSDLAAALQEEADASEGMQRAWVLFRLGRTQEQHLNQPDAAVASYRAAAEADPSAGPAVEAAAHLLAAAGRHRELVELLQDTLTRLDDPNLVVTTLYRIGELCEGPLDDQDGARTAFERILDTAPGYLPALEGLERVYTRLKAWDTLAAVYEQRAILAEEPQAIALQLHRAGSVCEFRLSDGDRAQDFYSRALENVPDFPPSLDATVRIMEGAGDWVGLGRVLRAASEATKDSNEIVSLTYRAARILADRVGDDAQAMALLRRCLQLSPGFLPAIQLLRDLATQGESWQDVYDLHRLEADAAEDLDRRHWRMLVAAEAADRTADVDAAAVVTEILEEDAGNIGALRLLEEHALASGDAHDLLAVYQRMAFGAEDDETRTRLAVRIAELAADVGDAVTAMNAVSEVIAAEGSDRPLGALARLAERANYWEEAQRALIAQGEGPAQAELARIQEAWIEDATAAGRTWATLLERNPADVEAAAGLERALARAGSRDGLAHAHGVLADHLPDPAVAAVHALLAGHLYEADDDIDSAIIYYDKAFTARPVPGKAFDALRRVLGQRRDADGLVELFGRLTTPAPLDLALALEEAGAPAQAAARYRGLLADEDLSDARRLVLLVRLEQDLVELEEWKGLFETLGVRLALTLDDDERAAMESQRRWILAEHLAETDEAWDFYRQLHEDDPQDVDVLEALARIAGARGETGLAIQYLEGLAQSTTDPSTAARYQRRIAEAHLVGNAPDLAREALMRALDYEPGDLESLHLLKDLATQAEDWPAVVGALARESTILQGDAQIACYREIAATWQDLIGNADVAADAWRKVLEVAPDDPEALRRLVDLSRTAQSWTQLVEYGSALVHNLDGADRAAMLTELGRTQLEKLHNEEEAVRLLDAASRNLDGNLEAAQILERIHASRGQWDRVAEAVARQATASPQEERVPLLTRAAEILSDTLHDRPGAADVYASILEIDPTNIEALRFRGDYLFIEGQLADAVVAYQALDGWEKDLDLDDFDDQMEAALYQFRFGEALRRLGRKDEALDHYQAALAFNTAHMPSLEAVGPILIEREDWDAAGGVYRKLLQLIGGQGDSERLCRTYTNLGTIERHQGKLDKAKKRFTKALDIKANDIKALQGMAAVLFARKDWNNLLNVYNNIIYHAQEPTDVIDAYVTKGFVLDAKMNLPDKAAQHYEKSLAFNPAQPASLLRLSELALRRQDWPEAGSLADRGLALDQLPSGLEAGLLLAKAVAHTACGDNAAGKAACQGAIEVDITLPDELGEDPSIVKMADVLKARLQATP
ncbi:MAG: tetratricopeptide repeat protein [Oligoflexia bacterium]|nr:tetratricopeptide repeat protein [Oligoflexia bacterium]